MANLISNGIEITIENKQVSLTNLYTAIGKPPNKAPTNFKTSKEGKQKINKYSDRKSFINRSRVRASSSFMRMLAQNHQICVAWESQNFAPVW
jgi:hypothetical protein